MSADYQSNDGKAIPFSPACCFPDDVERTYDRGFEAFAKAWKL